MTRNLYTISTQQRDLVFAKIEKWAVIQNSKGLMFRPRYYPEPIQSLGWAEVGPVMDRPEYDDIEFYRTDSGIIIAKQVNKIARGKDKVDAFANLHILRNLGEEIPEEWLR